MDWKSVVDQISFCPYLAISNKSTIWIYFIVVLNISSNNPTISIFKATDDDIDNIEIIIENTKPKHGLFTVDIIPTYKVKSFHQQYFGNNTETWIPMPKNIYKSIQF